MLDTIKIVGNCPHCGKDNLRPIFYDMNHRLVIVCEREKKMVGVALMKNIEFWPSVDMVEASA